MIKYICYLLLVASVMLHITPSTLAHFSDYTVQSTLSTDNFTGCSMYGINQSFIEARNFPPSVADPPMVAGTCQFNSIYSGEVCCNYNQSLILKGNMALASGIFGKCSACMNNVWDLWCASSCSPNQSQYMQPITVDNTTDQIISTYYYLHPNYAEGLYNSCRDVITGGSVSFAHLYPTYPLFFTGIFAGPNNPAFSLVFAYDANIGYYGNIDPCGDSCSCDSCRDACEAIPELDGLNLNTSLPTTTLFNTEIPILSVWMIYSYMGFVLSTFSGISLWMIFNIFKRTQKIKWILLAYAIIVIYISGLIVPLASGVNPAHSSKCTYKMPYGVEWNCGIALFVAIYSPSLCLIFASLSLILYLFKDRFATSGPNFNTNDSGYSNITSLHFGDNSPNSSPPSSPKFQGIGIKDPSLIQKMFFIYAKFITRHPVWVILGVLVFTAGCSIGIIRLQIEQDPVKLWVSPTSRSAVEKAFFDEHFGPFYRTEQMIISNRTDPTQPILSYKNIMALMELEIQLMNISIVYEGKNITLNDLCFQPTHRGCIGESITGYWQRNVKTLRKDGPGGYNGTISYCYSAPTDFSCVDNIGVPVNPNVVLGNWTNTNIYAATAFVTTFLLNNQPANLTVNEAWEKVWLENVAAYNANPNSTFHIAYSAERSVQDELAREGAADIPTILISYSVMFFYVSIALGRYYPFPKRFSSIFVNSRFTLGLCGIIIVAFSIAISVGICSVIGIKATLIISEVIPFLVLAIGVDNIFILVNTFESLHVSTYNAATRTTTRPLPEETLARALAKVGPSMALASLSESLAFLLGALTKMPAVVAFSFYASVAIFFDFLIQISAFAVLLVMDTKRTESRRIDCMPCVPLDGELSDDDEPEKHSLLDSSTNSTYDVTYKKKDGFLKLIFKKYYAPFLVHPVTKVCVCVIFVGMLLTGITYALQLQLGLEQSVALPRDSYLQDYFAELAVKLEVGPPVYIVIKGAYNYSDIQKQDQVCTIGGCSANSIVNIYNAAPYIEPGINSWLDDYLQWCQSGSCYLIYPNGTECDDPNVCNAISTQPSYRPDPDHFLDYLPSFLSYMPTNPYGCTVAGISYESDIVVQDGIVLTTKYDAYHTTLRVQEDFINSMKAAYYVADHYKGDYEVFPYSVFYVYFEQYLTIVDVAIMDIGLALVGVLIVSMLILANPIISLLVVLCVALVSFDLLGVMALWNVNLNAVSLVNVVMAIGISIEFCVHIAHTFIHAPKHYTKDEKAKFAVSEVGSSIVSGIFITKLLGVVVLGFSNSEIFQVYYFRMYISIVILGGLHGLVLLPVLLSLFGTDRFSFPALFGKKQDYQISLQQ